MKCGRSKVPAVDGQLPWNWSCSPRCPKGKGMYRAHGDVYQCNSVGWMEQSFQQRSFDFEDYDDETPTLPLADCAARGLLMGTEDSFQLVYMADNINGTLDRETFDLDMENEEFQASVIPQSVKDVLNTECAEKTKGTNLRFEVDLTVSSGSPFKVRRIRQRREDEESESDQNYYGEPSLNAQDEENPTYGYEYYDAYGMANDVGMGAADVDSSGVPFTVNVGLSFQIKQVRHIDWATQELARQSMRDCVGSVLSSFEAQVADGESEEEIGDLSARAVVAKPPSDMDSEIWPFWDREGAGCPAGSVLIGGSPMDPIKCQACPRGTVYVSKQRGLREICRPCPSGTWMDKEGQIQNDAGELGECNACPSNAFMTNVFPAYTKETCQKTSCFPNRTKFQVVFALDSSGSVTRPDYIRMREFAKTIVNRMCINNSQDGGSKSCGQAAYVIYNQSAESYMKFKQVVEHVDFNKIDNYEYRGGPARIGDLFEFIHGTYIDTTQLKSGLPLNIVLISDGQTQNDDKEQLEKWTRILKKKVTKIITLSKRSIFNENTLQIASSIDDRYFMNDYHELPGFVYPVMEKLCQSVADHKGNLLRTKKNRLEQRKLRGSKKTGKK